MTEVIYLDTAPVIYMVEKVPPWASLVRSRVERTGVTLITSEMTRMECRVGPLRNNDQTVLQDFEDYLSTAVSQILPLTRGVMDHAAEIRARYGFKTPDAIHLAAAVVSGCDVFLTNDHRLDRFAGIAVETIQP